MSGHALTPRARQDLDEIWAHSSEHWGENRAELYMREIWHGITAIANDPRRGQTCDDIRVGYRKYSVAQHVLFFRPGANGIDIVRILHARMDFLRHL